jgi:phage repressor protein C with HTH and peptisase S24 domain
VVKTTGHALTVNELKRRTAKTIELTAIAPAHGGQTLSVRDVLWMARIVWASQ